MKKSIGQLLGLVIFSVPGDVACNLVSQCYGLDVRELGNHLLVVLKVIREPVVVVSDKIDCHAFDVCWPYFSHVLAPLCPVNADWLF